MISTHDALLSASSATPPLDLELIKKYAAAAPRYTSYPPATQFTADLPAIRFEDAIAEDNATGVRPLSLYIHLPFCESRCWYCGCTTVITRNKSAADTYLDDLAREIALYNLHLDSSRRVVQLHLGGGTPTFFTARQLDRLGELLRCYFQFDKDAEISVEIDPRRLSWDQVEALVRLGARRASLGIQDTDRRVQLAIHRHQPHALNEQAFTWLRAAGFSSINVDLIYGLPLQTVDSFDRTLDDVLGLEPDRLSVFGYAHVPWLKPSQNIFDERGQLPDAETRLALWQLAHQRLTSARYIDIGLDHFARPQDELAVAQREQTLHRNFQGYSTRAGASVYAFGMSAISSIGNVYFQNARSLTDYHDALQAGRLPVQRGLRLTDEDARRRTLIMRLMCDRRLDFRRLSADLGIDVRQIYATELASLDDLERDGAVELSETELRVTSRGAPLLRVIAQRFDAYHVPSTGRHSQAI
ncbi:oxygen-independent coproporphyrinogen III oxidase [Nibricoccus aquaticus]|uniref:Coproporphyrinogen-III oxidase n=1 Tax=Nibricoccus aquaticus TaxID=2576891 RepID=A0A290QMB9_9BACT|nr:oxygen-independent coproporphyrinogen III oxidase [Nibricoccus aquaticus]ATC65741.1 oxygen-independent coproporphyrinogen III oxidase [Nibricoccus aquaticus]